MFKISRRQEEEINENERTSARPLDRATFFYVAQGHLVELAELGVPISRDEVVIRFAALYRGAYEAGRQAANNGCLSSDHS